MANRVRSTRLDLGLRATAVARRARVSRSQLYDIEEKGRTPSVLLALRLARVLGRPVDELFFEEDVRHDGQADSS